MDHALAAVAACSLAVLLIIAWQAHAGLRQLAALREELRELRRASALASELRPAPLPPPGEPPSEAFRSGVMMPPPTSANPALTSIAKHESPAVVNTSEMARLVEGFKQPKT